MTLEKITKRLEVQDDNYGDYVVFDFDGTCIKGDVEEAFMEYLIHENISKAGSSIFDGFDIDSKILDNEDLTFPEKVKESYFYLQKVKNDHMQACLFSNALVVGYSQKEVSVMISDMLKAILNEQSGFNFDLGVKEEILNLIQECKDMGLAVYIVSASCDAIVKSAVAELLDDIPEGRVFGKQVAVDDEVYTSKRLDQQPIEKRKVDCIKTSIEIHHNMKPPLLVAGDSMNDEPMGKYGKVFVAVDPKNKDLEEAMVDKGDDFVLMKTTVSELVEALSLYCSF